MLPFCLMVLFAKCKTLSQQGCLWRSAGSFSRFIDGKSVGNIWGEGQGPHLHLLTLMFIYLLLMYLCVSGGVCIHSARVKPREGAIGLGSLLLPWAPEIKLRASGWCSKHLWAISQAHPTSN